MAVISAANLVLSRRLTLRKAAEEFSISRSTLSRHIKKHKGSDNETFIYEAINDTKKIFTEVEETEIVKYLKIAANMHYGLSLKEVCKLAYSYAVANKISRIVGRKQYSRKTLANLFHAEAYRLVFTQASGY